MKSVAIGEEARSDPLIVAIGNEWMIKNLGNRLMRKSYTSHAMRLLARLKTFEFSFHTHNAIFILQE